MSRLVALLLLLLLVGCGGTGPGSPDSSPAAGPTDSPRTSGIPGEPANPTTDAPEPSPAPGTVPPAWLGTRPLPVTASGYGEVRPTPRELRRRRFTLPDRLPALPGTGFAAEVERAPDDVIARSTWEPGCPVDRDELAWVRVTFHGFDGARHTGELLVASAASQALVGVFRELWRADFPLEEMRISTRADLDAPPTGDGNNTEAFVCRPVTGGTSYSEHAYGLALDLNSFQNPYEKGEVVLPELASSYLDRDRVRPGMITPDGPVVRAFARIGWGWGGAWSSLKDYQHFSHNSR
ncbi:MAG TPA: M15 family metallopeptidase [Nocardioides sp.]|uniref:M15 family metallopeptidase n=1 Tax=Nocardioides sp. TaxID=35761 RepID=UPI002D0384C7|nr:M15 family metallopeptidase [Nocardioides sp.]HTW15991.1 M15 family metallopeptidase [Nocardioides sp.]